MKIRNRFSERVAYIALQGPGRTQQHFRDQVDINNIFVKYRKTGVIEHVKRTQERFGDIRDLADYTQDLDKVAKAQQAFEMLPAELRNQFKNSISGFFEYIKNDENRPQLEKWGFVNKKPEEPKAGTPAAAEYSPEAKKTGAPKVPKKTAPSTEGDEA